MPSSPPPTPVPSSYPVRAILTQYRPVSDRRVLQKIGSLLAAVHATLIPSQQSRDGQAQRGESQRIGVPAGYFRATQRFQLYSGVEYSGEWATATAVGRYGLPLVAAHALRSKRGCIVVVVVGVGTLHGRGDYAVSEEDSTTIVGIVVQETRSSSAPPHAEVS